jgi:glycosyltransferase involved in cell wall biosynthesis
MTEARRPLKVTVIATVLNEEKSVVDLIESLAAQTRQPDEVIISDGGSSDGTVERVRATAGDRLNLRILELPGANISEGRNAAVGQATGDVIAVTDAGVRLKSTWLEQLVTPFEKRPGRVDVVSGFFEPDPKNVFELAMGATVLPTREEINPARFLPSSRSVAFTKEAWRRAGGYPEWLDYCEDVLFDLALRRAGCIFAWAPGAVAEFRPRGSLRAFWAQYFRYARGDGKAKLWPWRHAIRYASYGVGLALLGASRGRKPMPLLPLAVGAALHLKAPYRRLLPQLKGLSPLEKVEAIAWVPAIRVVGDLAKMAGYPVGILWRLRQTRQL